MNEVEKKDDMTLPDPVLAKVNELSQAIGEAIRGKNLSEEDMARMMGAMPVLVLETTQDLLERAGAPVRFRRLVTEKMMLMLKGSVDRHEERLSR